MWLGLETIHKLTSAGSYSLHIRMKDYDQKCYVAVYDQFQVISIAKRCSYNSPAQRSIQPNPTQSTYVWVSDQLIVLMRNSDLQIET